MDDPAFDENIKPGGIIITSPDGEIITPEDESKDDKKETLL